MSGQAPVTIRRYGPEAWLVETDDPAAWARGVGERQVAGVVEVVPAEETVLVVCARDRASEVRDALGDVEPVGGDEQADTVRIAVVYDGDDLDGVAAEAGLSVDEVVEAHTATTYTVAFCGFSPGFAYLRGLDRRLHRPRRTNPRTAVPAGSVAIAAHYSAVYPRATPGGWHLLGRTDVQVWDLDSPTPALLRPGTRVRFERVR